MNKVANFFKSILPFLLVIVLQFVLCLVTNLIDVIQAGGGAAGIGNAFYNTLLGSYGEAIPSPYFDVLYGALCILIFWLWYRHSFLVPFRDKKRTDVVRGFSFHTIVAIIFLSIGLYYVADFVVNTAANLQPVWMDAYNALMTDAGYQNPSILLIVYSVVLAPIAEELIFRGLIMRYARYALPFWIANIWQALLFGLYHGNFMQGLYAFVIGLFLGFVAHRGRGIRYSIPVHIVFNFIGMFFSGLIGITLELSYPIAILCGVALTIFAVWLFYTDFTPADENSPRKRDRRSD